eukprot:4901830-Prymnesium_polylepis.1
MQFSNTSALAAGCGGSSSGTSNTQPGTDVGAGRSAGAAGSVVHVSSSALRGSPSGAIHPSCSGLNLQVPSCSLSAATASPPLDGVLPSPNGSGSHTC